ncbi:MAG: hypothetical protein DBX55_02270 [Verrucomicrobia bacterium]|nr:MAG: hypothetical protein DBX55_02270 [Verrucomicrobiota bacterium]
MNPIRDKAKTRANPPFNFAESVFFISGVFIRLNPILRRIRKQANFFDFVRRIAPKIRPPSAAEATRKTRNPTAELSGEANGRPSVIFSEFYRRI